MQKIIVLCGPTAGGKTKLAIALAEKFNGEIISADSGQVWRELDVGTAKPTPEDRRRIPHHLIDVVTPGEHFDVSHYCTLADKAIADIARRGKMPFVVGGTGMYLRVLLYGLCKAPKQDLRLRKKLEERIKKGGSEKLYQELKKIDPALAEKISPNDKTRVIRGLEVYELAGAPLSAFQEEHKLQKPRYDALQIGLSFDRAAIRERIDKRVDWMIANGWGEEVRELLKFYSAASQAFKTIGYKQWAAHLRGENSLEKTAGEIKKQTKAFAKRQMTWFKADKSILWVPGDDDQKNLVDFAADSIHRFLGRARA
ncbi:MAG: tRNA (adenosine(37)-N6)-dimethylallyltransferase MiaA [Deltaproteobacteria bacterium]|nr:tRNA (adenosine(37)-N6)-dimethylallyltransferase MiaA [Deltaproteobacteria bacterium]MDZ4224797.1 tRNA (adenosine(37)-N6)-dimethylallyltransferase MiaA [bacterium]